MPRFSRKYLRHLHSPGWRVYRRRVLARDGYRCVQCGSRRRLEVDHLTYVRLGQEWLGDCQTLCHTCHDRKTRASRRQRGQQSFATLLAGGVVVLLWVLWLLQ
jgi:5-methylcytosine-specific restriction endonuclease McrA